MGFEGYTSANRKAALSCYLSTAMSRSRRRTPMTTKHSRRFSPHGTPAWHKVRRTLKPDPNRYGCVTCDGVVGNHGYILVSGPRVSANKQPRFLAHRLSLAAKLGRDIRPSHIAMHTCDNPRCVLWAHLREGTDADNLADMRAKGRHCHGAAMSKAMAGKMPRGDAHRAIHAATQVRGENHGRAKLTKAQSDAVRVAMGTHDEIGARFGVSGAQVGRIKAGKSRKGNV